MINEQWVPVVGFEKDYEVSSLGRIKRVSKGMSTTIGRIIGGYTDNCRRYPYVVLHVNGKASRRSVHRLVAEAFLGPPPTLLHVVNHLDGDIARPHANNLEWSTQRDNQLHAIKSGLKPVYTGDDAPRSLLTEDEVKALRTRQWIRGEKSAYAKARGVHPSTLYKAISGTNWKYTK